MLFSWKTESFISLDCALLVLGTQVSNTIRRYLIIRSSSGVTGSDFFIPRHIESSVGDMPQSAKQVGMMHRSLHSSGNRFTDNIPIFGDLVAKRGPFLLLEVTLFKASQAD